MSTHVANLNGGAAQQKETTRSPHGPLTIPCENCHTAAGWRPIRAVPEFDHNKTKYPLRGMHEKVECVACHVKPVFTNVGKNCADCHADVHRRQMGSNCEQCHTVNGWNIAVQQVKDHQNRFPLLGAHAAVQCEECHKQAATGIFLGLSTQCDSCHLKDWQRTTNPPHPNAGPAFASALCQGCHNFDSWLGAKFDHSTTGFLLTNGHANLACTACHINNNYNLQIAPTACGTSGCHLSTWQQTNNPVHSTAGPTFAAANCYNCHTSTVSWTLVTFNHASTGFPLTNGHANVPCASCHTNNNYTLTTAPTDCGNSGCHLTTWQTTNNPVHATAGASFAATNCSQCHDTIAWTDLTSFNHSVTGFALTGAHISPNPTPCASCHVNNNYTLTIQPTDCGNSSCHLTQWNSTQTMGGTVPNHITAGFPIAQCSTCHNTTSWASATFNHSTTGFPLTGSHQMAPAGKVTDCAQCHINNNYTLSIQPTDCGNSGCHLTTWQTTNNPVHSTAGAPFAAANCSTCHDTITWTDNTFNHAVTGFTLTGAHISPNPTPCVSCHVNNNYTLTIQPTDCGNSSCHLTQWNSTQTLGGTVPNHITSGFPMAQCSTCHDTVNWADATFNHSTTGFPLTNSHQMAPAGKVTACAQCHINNNYSLTIQPTDCGNSGCHLTTWQTTNNPNHQTAGAAFAAANCSTCHDTITWTDNAFNHSVTGFALVGTHMSPNPTPCASCHVNNNYTLNSADCMGCHLTAWNSTQTLGGNVPNHVAANFPQTASACSGCHTITTWSAGMFDHSTTGWALTGAHQMPPAAGSKIVGCTDCHVNGNYTLTSANTLCYSCHTAAWNSTATLGGAVPNHITAQYPTTCESCHTTTTWLGAVFNHTFFPIPHHTSTSVCNDCHQVSTDYSSFTCINCHSDTNAHRPGMSHPNVCSPSPSCWYQAETCYTCHKNGGGG
ncbi:MAG: hypothetical protein WBL63_08255 [Candidatus Acidiferrum sp.]